MKESNNTDNSLTSISLKVWSGVERITVVLGLSGAVLIIVLMILTTADVFFRYVFGNPIKGAYEISEILFVATVFLGMAYTQLFRGHVRVEILVSRLPVHVNLILDTVMLMLALSIFGLMTWKGVGTLIESIRSGEHYFGLIRIPLWPARLMIPLGTCILCLRFIGDMVLNIHKLFTRKRECHEH